MGKQSFIQGAFILLVANIIVKIVGFVYQIFIVRMIGTEGIGIFNMIYPMYITALVITTSGIPLATSRFVAAQLSTTGRVSAERILGMSIALLLTAATIVSLVLLFTSSRIIKYFYSDLRVIPCFFILIPSLLIVSLASAIKHFFQGTQDMRPTATNQLIEQIIRFISGTLLVYLLYPYGLTWAAIGLASAILLSELGGFIYLRQLFFKRSLTKKLFVRPSIEMTKELYKFGIPVTVTRIVLTLVSAFEASIIPKQLMKAGYTLSQATSFYGELTGVVFTLMSIPSTLSFSLATTLVPAASEAQSNRNKNILKKRGSDALGVTLIAGVPSALILFFWGPNMTNLLFKAQHAGYILKLISVTCIFLYMAQTTSGILQGIGCVRINFVNTLISSSIRLAGIIYLGCNPTLGTTGIAISYCISFVVLGLLNLLVVRIKTGLSIDVITLIRLLIAGSLLSFLLQNTSFLVENSIPLLISLTLIYLLLFLLFLLLTGDKNIKLLLNQVIKK